MMKSQTCYAVIAFEPYLVPRMIGVFTAICLFFFGFTGCSPLEQLESEVIPQVTLFHLKFNEDIDALWDIADLAFQRGQTRDQFTEQFEMIKQKSGRILSTELLEVEWSSTLIGQEYIVRCKSHFEYFQVQELFVFRQQDGGPVRLLSYSHTRLQSI